MADAPVLPVETAHVAPAPAPAAPAPAPVAAAPVAPAAPAPAPEPRVSEVPSLLETLKSAPTAPVVEEPKAPEPEKAAEAPKAPEAPKPEEPKAPEPEKAADAPKAPEAPKPEPIVEKPTWKLEFPETLRADEKQVGEFTSLLDAIVSPSEALTREAAGQKLIDMHNSAMIQYAEQLQQEQHRVFNATRKEWNQQVMADPDIGGSGYETAQRAIARMRDRFVSSAPPGTAKYEKDMNEFAQALRITGAGDHPAILRVFHNVAQAFDEPRMPPPNPNPPPGNGPRPNGKSVLYDNPRSTTGRA